MVKESVGDWVVQGVGRAMKPVVDMVFHACFECSVGAVPFQIYTTAS